MRLLSKEERKNKPTKQQSKQRTTCLIVCLFLDLLMMHAGADYFEECMCYFFHFLKSNKKSEEGEESIIYLGELVW